MLPNSQSLSKDKSAHTLLHFILLPITFDTSNTSLLGGLWGQVKRRGQREGCLTTGRTERRLPHHRADREKAASSHGGQREGCLTTGRIERRLPHHTTDREKGESEGCLTTRRTERREPHHTADREKGASPQGGQREGSLTTGRTERREPHHRADREKGASPHGGQREGSRTTRRTWIICITHVCTLGADVGAGQGSTGGLHMERLHTKY